MVVLTATRLGLWEKVMLNKRALILMRIFTPTCRMTVTRTICTLVAHNGWTVHQLDIKNAFLKGDLHEEVYVASWFCSERARNHGVQAKGRTTWFEASTSCFV